jgi:putative DNA primase/helicase
LTGTLTSEHVLYGISEVTETLREAFIRRAEEREAQGIAPFGDDDEAPDEHLPAIRFPGEQVTVEWSEDALSLALADRHKDEWRHVQKWGCWMYFRGGRWTIDDKNRTLTYARKVCRTAALEADEKKLGSAQTVAAVERLTRWDDRLAMSVDDWDHDPWALNTPSGTVDLRTGVWREHKRSDYITKVTAIAPADTGCPLFLQFMETITDDKPDLVAFLQRSLGYGMTGVTREHALFFWYGHGGNGKSVLLNTVSRILGEYHTAAAMETFVESHGDRHPTELASLRGAHMVTSVETEKGRNWAEAKIKALTGGDPITARFMRQDFFTFTPQFKLFIAGNHKPSLRSVDQAIRRRFYLVPFTVNIPKDEQDKDLEAKLVAEWPAILHWLIRGCLEWQRIGLAPPSSVTEATEEYLASEDSIANWIADRCVADAAAWESVTALFGSFSDWAQKVGEKWGTQKEFKQALEKSDLVCFRKTNRGSGYAGLKINPMRPADAS